MVLVFCLVALVALAVLIFRLATLTVPVLAGLGLGLLAYRTGAGWPGALAVGFLAAGCAMGLGQWLAAPGRPTLLRIAVGVVFAAPAALIGFFLVHGLIETSVPAAMWRVALSSLGAAVVGASTFAKVGGMALVMELSGQALPPLRKARHVV